MALPEIYSPDDVAKHFGWSPRRLRSLARQIGACSIVGNKMILTEADVQLILEKSRPETVIAPPKATGSYAELVKLRSKGDANK
ncbi:hypothetical protein HJA87_12165 [Rhizobium bangladeshense]|uniref:DNA-binding protein n=1 Tax=Rhizobium bangladeshense TaxID=1138189 RepID=A0ABS7LIQ7_9HYPH|nr:hypothetical protein [Rhizobium bangladeshense]MBY3590633.1 hypothetical protein [Rhizobium bangladeshense]